jgi:hypothetical protein
MHQSLTYHGSAPQSRRRDADLVDACGVIQADFQAGALRFDRLHVAAAADRLQQGLQILFTE